MHDRARAKTTHSEQGGAGSRQPPWTDHGHAATGAPKSTTDCGDRQSTYPTNSISIELSLRLSPEADAPGLTRGNFRRFSLMQRALKIASEQTERAGHRAGADGWLEAVRSEGWADSGTADGAERWGRPTRSHRDRPGRCAAAMCSGGPSNTTNEPRQCLHALTRGGRRGAWHQLGLLMGSCFTGCQPARI